MHLVRNTAAPTEPRGLSPALREELGLRQRAQVGYRWTFAAVVVATASLPLMLAKMWAACIVTVVGGLGVLPLLHKLEGREAAFREKVYRLGVETVGRVLEVEPAGPGASDHVVRLEFLAGSRTVRASVVGCPLARRGLAADDEIHVYYFPERPTRCFLGRRIKRDLPPRPGAGDFAGGPGGGAGPS